MASAAPSSTAVAASTPASGGDGSDVVLPKTMQAVRKLKAETGFELVTVPVPSPKAGEVLLKSRDPPFCEGRLTPPITTGHEVCGQVVAVGSGVTTLAVGDLVSAESHIPCVSQGRSELCGMCKRGNGHICEHVQFFSVDVDGFLAEYAAAPANILWKNPKDMDHATAALQESLGNSVYTVAESNVKGKVVAVFGCGPTGLNAIAVAVAMGALQVIAVAGSASHLELAAKMGATTVIDRHAKDVVQTIKDLTNGVGADVCLEMSGSAFAFASALDAVMTTGMVTILGLYSAPLTVDVSKKIVLKDVTVRGIYGRRIWQTWEMTAKLLQEGMDVSPVITHRFTDLKDFPQAIDLMHKGACGKCVFFPNGTAASS